MTRDEETMVKAHLLKIVEQAETGDEFAIQTLSCIVLMMEMARGGGGGPDGGGEDDAPTLDNIIYLFGVAA